MATTSKPQAKTNPLPASPLATPKGRSKALAPSLSRSEGEGWGGVLFATTSKPQAKANPLPASPLATPKGRSKALAPSLSRSEGEGWGGVLFATTSKPQAKANPLPASPLATPKGRSKALAPPFRVAKGRVGEGCSWQQPQSLKQKPTPPSLPLGYAKGEEQSQAWRKTLRTLSAPTRRLHGFPATSSPFPASAACPRRPAAGACSVSIPRRPCGTARGCADRCPDSSGSPRGG